MTETTVKTAYPPALRKQVIAILAEGARNRWDDATIVAAFAERGLKRPNGLPIVARSLRRFRGRHEAAVLRSVRRGDAPTTHATPTVGPAPGHFAGGDASLRPVLRAVLALDLAAEHKISVITSLIG